MEKSMQENDNSKEICASAVANPGECKAADLIIREGLSGEKVEAMLVVVVATPITEGAEVQSIGKFLQLERSTVDPSAVAGASILASLSNLLPDLSRWNSPAQSTNKIQQGTDLPTHVDHDSTEVDLDRSEGNSTANVENDKAVGIGAIGNKFLLNATRRIM